MYELYAQNMKGSWKSILKSNNLEQTQQESQQLNNHEYMTYMIIEHSPKGDQVLERQELSRECKIEFVDKIDTEYTVKAMTFQPSKMKQKEKLRKMIEKYEER